MQYHNNLYHQDMLLKKGYVVGGSGEFCSIETPSDVDNLLTCKQQKKTCVKRNKHRYKKSMNKSSKIDLFESYFKKS